MEEKKLPREPVRDVAGLSEWRTSDGVSALRNEMDYQVDYSNFWTFDLLKLNEISMR